MTKCVMGFRSGCGMRWNQRERRKSILDFVVVFSLFCTKLFFLIVKIYIFAFKFCISLLWTDLLSCSLKFRFFILGRSIETAQRPTENKLSNL